MSRDGQANHEMLFCVALEIDIDRQRDLNRMFDAISGTVTFVL
jgi:hypothetical protein